MKIHTIEKIGSENSLRLQFPITFDGKERNFPTALYYQIEKKFESLLSLNSDSALVAMLLLAMNLKEDIFVEGSVSEQLINNLLKYQDIVHEWFPKTFYKIKISAEHIVSETKLKNKAVGMGFSGGVDSFYTLWSHLAPQEKDASKRVTHGIFVHGFDFSLPKRASYDRAYEAYKVMLESLGLTLIGVETNIRQFTDYYSWEMAHGSALGSCALLFEKVFGTFYIASSDVPAALKPLGSHPDLDPLLSSNQMTVVHDGLQSSRVKKIKALITWPLTYDNLRTCWRNQDGVKNCGRCDYCLRVMAILEAFGVLGKYTTYPPSFSYNSLINAQFVSKNRQIIADEIIALAKKNHNEKLAGAVKRAKERGALLFKIKPLTDFVDQTIYHLMHKYQ